MVEMKIFVNFFFISRLENEKLRAQLKKKDDEVIQTRATLERFANAVSKFLLFSFLDFEYFLGYFSKYSTKWV